MNPMDTGVTERARSRAVRRFARVGAVATLAAGALAAAFAAPSSASVQNHQPSHSWTYVHLHNQIIKVDPHGRFGIVPMRHRGVRNAPLQPAANLQYGGGPVAHNPQVFLDFWGNQWNSDTNGVQGYMQSFVSGLGGAGDNWSTITSQYTDTTGLGPSFNGSVLAGTWVDNSGPAPAAASASDIAAEAVTAAQHFGVAGDDIQIVVLSPSGTQPDGFPNAGYCAYHSVTSSSLGNVPYTNLPYVLDVGASCGANSVSGPLDGYSIVEGHEYAETLTDPEPASGWVDPSGQEIGDLCAWQNLFTIGLSTGSFAMQPLWSNTDGGCTQQAP
jgi:hypothetical protein